MSGSNFLERAIATVKKVDHTKNWLSQADEEDYRQSKVIRQENMNRHISYTTKLVRDTSSYEMFLR